MMNVGITSVNVRIVDPSGNQLASFSAMRFEGTALAGTYRNDWVVPCNAKPCKEPEIIFNDSEILLQQIQTNRN